MLRSDSNAAFICLTFSGSNVRSKRVWVVNGESRDLENTTLSAACHMFAKSAWMEDCLARLASVSHAFDGLQVSEKILR